MKKKYCLILAIAVILSLFMVGCNSNSATIYNKAWQFSIVQDETKQGEITHCSSLEKDLHPGAKVVDITCAISENNIVIVCGEEKFVLKFKEVDSVKNEETIYSLTMENSDIEGMASVGVINYDDGSQGYTLILSYNKKVLVFHC